MANYLLECEIVGGEISVNNEFIFVQPTIIYPKSNILTDTIPVAFMFKATTGFCVDKQNSEVLSIKVKRNAHIENSVKLAIDKTVFKDEIKTFSTVVLKIVYDKANDGKIIDANDCKVVGIKF